MLQAIPEGFFASRFRLVEGNRTIGTIRNSGWREKGEFEIDGKTIHLYRTGVFSGPFLLELDGKTLASAEKPSAFRDQFELHIGNGLFMIRPRSMWKQAFDLYSGDEKIGSVEKVKWYSNKVIIDLPQEWPEVLRGFVFWLVLLLWKRAEEAAT